MNMEFLKDVLGDMYDEVAKKLKDAGVKLADLSKGEYISKDKFLNREKELKEQIATLNTQISSRDNDLANLNETLSKVKKDAEGLSEAQSKLTSLQQEYANEKANFEKQLIDQKREYALRESTSGIKFSSNSAKKAFIADAKAKNFTLDDDSDKLIGFNEFLESYKISDPDAFVNEKQEEKNDPKPVITLPNKNKDDEDKPFVAPLIL